MLKEYKIKKKIFIRDLITVLIKLNFLYNFTKKKYFLEHPVVLASCPFMSLYSNTEMAFSFQQDLFGNQEFYLFP